MIESYLMCLVIFFVEKMKHLQQILYIYIYIYIYIYTHMVCQKTNQLLKEYPNKSFSLVGDRKVVWFGLVV